MVFLSKHAKQKHAVFKLMPVAKLERCTESSRACWAPPLHDTLDYYTCPINFHVVQRGLMGGDICRMCPAHSIADGNGAECWACRHGDWRAVMHCDNFFSRAYYADECSGPGKQFKNIRGRLYKCVGHTHRFENRPM